MKTIAQEIKGNFEKADQETFMFDAENGVGELFSFGIMDFLEASRYTNVSEDNEVLEDTITYYVLIKDLETSFFKVSESVMMEFMKINFSYNQEFKHEMIMERIFELGLIQVVK